MTTLHAAGAIRTPLPTVLARLRERRAVRADRRRMERELAAHITPNDLTDLVAAVARYDESAGADVYRMIEDRLVA